MMSGENFFLQQRKYIVVATVERPSRGTNGNHLVFSVPVASSSQHVV
jgi:hypothetical protein